MQSRKAETEHYNHPGRPQKGEVREKRTVWHAEVEVKEMKAEVLEEKEEAGVDVCISIAFDRTEIRRGNIEELQKPGQGRTGI